MKRARAPRRRARRLVALAWPASAAHPSPLARPAHGEPDGGRATRRSSRTRRSRAGSTATRRSRRPTPRSTARSGLDGERLVRASRRDRDRDGRGRRRRTWSRRGPGRRWRGRWRAAGRARSAASCSTSWPVWLGLSALFLLGLVDLRRPLVDADARPARPALVRRLARLLQPRRRLPERRARRSAARLPRCANRMDRLPRRPHGAGSTAVVWPVWALAVATLFLVGFRVGLNVDNGAQRDRRRLRRRDRRRPDPRRPGSVRDDAGDGRPEALRPGRLRRRDTRPDPGERPLRVRESARRHVRARRLSRLRAGRARLRLERAVGRASRGARDLDRVRPPRPRRSRPRRSAPRRRAPRRAARLRLGRVPVHDVRPDVEHERRNRAGDSRVGLLARLVTRRPGRHHGARLVDEVRLADRRAALAHVPVRPAARTEPAVRRRVRRRDGARVLDPPPRAVAP